MTVAPGALSWDEVCDYRDARDSDSALARSAVKVPA